MAIKVKVCKIYLDKAKLRDLYFPHLDKTFKHLNIKNPIALERLLKAIIN